MERGIQFVGLFARHIRQCGAKFALIFVVFKEWNLSILRSGLAAWHGNRQLYDWKVGGTIFKEACGLAVDCDNLKLNVGFGEVTTTACSISADIGKQAIAKVNKKINFHLLRIIKSNFAWLR